MPTALLIGNTEYKIDSDFRACLRIILAFEDNELTPQEKQIILLSIMYPKVPKDIEQALIQANWFLNCGKKNGGEETQQPRVYSFSKDAGFIFAAFKQIHNIDLQETDLHWWKFSALFMTLFGTETAFGNLVGIRHRIATGKATKEERAAAREMGDMLDVPEIDARTLEEKEAEIKFLRLVAQGTKK